MKKDRAEARESRATASQHGDAESETNLHMIDAGADGLKERDSE